MARELSAVQKISDTEAVQLIEVNLNKTPPARRVKKTEEEAATSENDGSAAA
jgi:CarD family transcriptional regulator